MAEQVQLLVNNVRYKKRDGSLYMMSERIAWCPEGKDQFELTAHYSDIKCQKVSPEGKAKVQLQIILLNGNSYAFHFAHDTQASAKSERDSVKNLLASMLPRFRKRIDKELEEKNKLLQTDPELFQTYKDLVVSGVITPQEFWNSHAAKLPTSDSPAAQNVGVSAAFLSDVRPQADGCNGLRYNLTADTIQSIFTTYPAVKKKYLEKVPDKLSEKEFWTMFFQSHYFHRDRVNHGTKDLFSDCVKKDDQDIVSLLNSGVKDIFSDLNYLYEEDSAKDEGYGASVDPGTSAKGKPSNTQIMHKNIIKRFNHQNAMILTSRNKAIDKQSQRNGEAAGDGEPPTKRTKLKEATTYDDLEENNDKIELELKLQNSDRYSHGPTLVNQIHQELSSRNVREGMNIVLTQCRNYRPKLALALSSDDAAAALTELSPDGAVGNSEQASTNIVQRLLSPEQQSELKTLYLSASELLRHFWLCFPANTPLLQEKVSRMRKSIEDFHHTRVLPFKEQLRRCVVHANVTEHLEDMFTVAYKKFHSWQSKKLRK
ncbi:general transcription factor IIH subunit 1-like [Clavelina lepadiformis]|uniref:BSD domain-containing protein n=1 Tax=Clavelina lepadiformis TaxID=159417 RepID=A0ABP0FDK5_CLALP